MLTLGISAAVTAWTLWERQSQKAAKATKELEEGTKTFIDTLKGVQRAQADGLANGIKETNNLGILYRASQNVNLSYEERKKQAQELIRIHPQTFGNHTAEAIVAGKASEAYEKLAISLMATAKAFANMNKVSENSLAILNRGLQASALGQELAKVQKQRIDADRNAEAYSTGGNAYGAENPLSANAKNKASALFSKEMDIRNQIINLNKENGKTLNENKMLEQGVIELLKQGADITTKGSQGLKSTKDTTKDINDLMNTLTGSVMSEYDRRLFEIKVKYDDIFKQIKTIGNASRQKDAFGLATQAKQFEDLRIEAERFVELTKGLKTTRPTSLTNGAIAPVLPNLEANSKNINKPVKANLHDWDSIVEDMEKNLNRAVSNFGRDFIKTLSTINQQADLTFGKVFSSIVGSGISGINEVVQQGLLKGVGDFFEGKMKDLGKKETQWVAGLGMAGSILSGVTKKSDAVGQIGGGALSGAAAGSVLLPGIGTAIGAALGAIGGLLSANSAKKQEQLQEDQLAEQRKQTALMERQNALAYASSIIGQRTVNGMVTSIDRDARGQLVAKVSGKDLDFVWQANNNRK